MAIHAPAVSAKLTRNGSNGYVFVDSALGIWPGSIGWVGGLRVSVTAVSGNRLSLRRFDQGASPEATALAMDTSGLLAGMTLSFEDQIVSDSIQAPQTSGDGGFASTLHRTITVAGFSADASPLATPPADSALFTLHPFMGPSQAPILSAGHVVWFRAVDGSGNDVPAGTGTVSFRTWIKDETTGSWICSAQVATTVNEIVEARFNRGRGWVQVLGITAPGATSIQVLVADMSSTAE